MDRSQDHRAPLFNFGSGLSINWPVARASSPLGRSQPLRGTQHRAISFIKTAKNTLPPCRLHIYRWDLWDDCKASLLEYAVELGGDEYGPERGTVNRWAHNFATALGNMFHRGGQCVHFSALVESLTKFLFRNAHRGLFSNCFRRLRADGCLLEEGLQR